MHALEDGHAFDHVESLTRNPKARCSFDGCDYASYSCADEPVGKCWTGYGGAPDENAKGWHNHEGLGMRNKGLDAFFGLYVGFRYGGKSDISGRRFVNNKQVQDS